MKTLLIVRHAKSSWANIGEADFDRSLNDRGMRDAPEMAKRVLQKKIAIDKFVSSPARRAKMTCEAFCKLYEYKTSDIQFVDKLYHAPVPVFYEAISELDNDYNTIALFSHNTGLTDFVNTLCNAVHVDNVPTCGVFAVTAGIKTWADFAAAEKSFLFFDFPKLTN